MNKHKNVVFTYFNKDNRLVAVTMTRAAPEWVNAEFPTLVSLCSDDDYSNNWRINSGLIGGERGGGTVIETCPKWMRDRFIRFVYKSMIAYQTKYGHSTINMWINFLKDCEKYSKISVDEVYAVLESEGE